MSYQVLARKWRPKNFEQLMGQEHVVTVLVNALAQQRLHHAYLFTGTRGVGKTTIARIFAKSLNCDQGISAQPCGHCDTCIDIDNGRFVDLLEIDAASRTKVDDTREILDNVQYAPSRGRYKVYLIDEVHMLSRSSFNALLKTLEEPPPHVKFILATTDPQKLPVTVISRCLQFHLKALTVKQIEDKLAQILAAEEVSFEPGVLTILAKAARGSMRDSLSLTDQAIAQGQGHIETAKVQQMLGGVDQRWVYKILICLLKQDNQGLMDLSQQLASYAPSYTRLLAELLQLLHQVALWQLTPQATDVDPELTQLLTKFSRAMSPETVQLYYQIALNGRKDLPYSADEQAGFDMTLLRMMAFRPLTSADTTTSKTSAVSSSANEDFEQIDIPDSQVPAEPVVIEPGITKPAADTPAAGIEQSISPEPLPAAQVEQQAAENPGVVPGQAEAFPEQKPQLADQPPLADHMVAEQGASAAEDDNQLDAEQQQLENIAREHGVIPPQQSAPDNHLQADVSSFSVATAPPESAAVQVAQTDSPIESHSPLDAVLAQRNMLRSRKKQLEGREKKPQAPGIKPTEELPAKQPLASSEPDSVRFAPVENLTQAVVESSAPSQQQTLQQAQLAAATEIKPQTEGLENIDPGQVKTAAQVDRWAAMIEAMGISGRLRQLANFSAINQDSNEQRLLLDVDASVGHLISPAAISQLSDCVSQLQNKAVTVELNSLESVANSPHVIQAQIDKLRHEHACKLLQTDPWVLQLQQAFDANVDEQSITAL
jgi:DNA polymerase-3 subunit gamma/tau